MQKIKLTALGASFMLVASVFAEGGFYTGLSAGYGTIDTNTTNGFSYPDGASGKGGGNMAGGVFLGYDFNSYLGIQADYDYIANVEYTMGSTTPGVSGTFSGNQQIIDLGVTGHLPFSLFANSLSGLSIFGKLAIGYTFTSFNGGSVVASSDPSLQVSLPSSSSNAVPVLGAGAEYGWSNVGIRAEYDYIGTTSITNDNETLMNVNDSLVLLSVFYHF